MHGQLKLEFSALLMESHDFPAMHFAKLLFGASVGDGCLEVDGTQRRGPSMMTLGGWLDGKE